jgi:RHS repeat-associated protein
MRLPFPRKNPQSRRVLDALENAPSLAASTRPRRASKSPASRPKNRVGVFCRRPPGRTTRCRRPVRAIALGCEVRRYETVSGRPFWLNRDPAGEEGGLNQYDYVDNDPIKLTDPLGLCTDQQNCIHNFLNKWYGSSTANFWVPEFSAYNYIPGMSNDLAGAYKSSAEIGGGKAALAYGCKALGRHMMENSHGLKGVWGAGDFLDETVPELAGGAILGLGVYSTAAQTAAYMACTPSPGRQPHFFGK